MNRGAKYLGDAISAKGAAEIASSYDEGYFYKVPKEKATYRDYKGQRRTYGRGYTLEPYGTEGGRSFRDSTYRDRQKRKGKRKVILGRGIRYGVPVLVYGSIGVGIYNDQYHVEEGPLESNRLHEAIGPLALPVTIAWESIGMAYDLTQWVGTQQRKLLGWD